MKNRGGLRQIIWLYSNWCVVTDVRITYTQRSDTMPEAELNAVTACYRFILFKSSASNKEAAEPTPGPYAAARVKHEEEVSHVGQQIQ